MSYKGLSDEDQKELNRLLQKLGVPIDPKVSIQGKPPAYSRFLGTVGKFYAFLKQTKEVISVSLIPLTALAAFTFYHPLATGILEIAQNQVQSIESGITDPDSFEDTDKYIFVLPPSYFPPVVRTRPTTTTTTTPEPIPSGSGTVSAIGSITGAGSNRRLEGATVLAASGLPPSVMPGLGMIRPEDYHG